MLRGTNNIVSWNDRMLVMWDNLNGRMFHKILSVPQNIVMNMNNVMWYFNCLYEFFAYIIGNKWWLNFVVNNSLLLESTPCSQPTKSCHDGNVARNRLWPVEEKSWAGEITNQNLCISPSIHPAIDLLPAPFVFEILASLLLLVRGSQASTIHYKFACLCYRCPHRILVPAPTHGNRSQGFTSSLKCGSKLYTTKATFWFVCLICRLFRVLWILCCFIILILTK